MISKEECIRDLLILSVGSTSEQVFMEKYPYIMNRFNTVFEVINAYFDNPPLKFEELEEEMWVWDNKEKMYIKSCNKYDTKEYGEGIRVQIGFDLVRYHYEENRYYRKQVKDE